MRNVSAFDVEKPEDSPGLLLWQTTITWQRLIKDALLDYDISHPQFVILAILLWLAEQKKSPNQVTIIEISKLDKMTVSQSLKKLAEKGLISRSEHKEDTRAKAVQLTQKGKNITIKLVKIVEMIDKEFFNKLEKNDHKSLVKILGILNQKSEI
jgi:DNA-binding MarR family transcriptional regulator